MEFISKAIYKLVLIAETAMYIRIKTIDPNYEYAIKTARKRI